MQRKTHRTFRILATILVGLAVLAGAAEGALVVTLRALRPVPIPVTERRSLRVPGPLTVGAAVIPIELPFAHSLAGFGPFRPRARGSTGPWEARALVIGKLAIVSLDVLEIPPSLSAVVSQSVGPNLFVWLCATHTHSGPGGYDPARLPQLAGARRFEPGVFAALAEAAETAITAASWSARPARLRWTSTLLDARKRGRSPGAEPDPTLWAVQAMDVDGADIATLVAYGAHPTFITRRDALASSDWPGDAAADLSWHGGVGLALQAIGGDSAAVLGPALTSELHPRTDDNRRTIYGGIIAGAAVGALATAPVSAIPDEELIQGPARLTWDPLEPFHVRLPGTVATVETTLRMAQLGKLRLVCLPGEITGAAWNDLLALDPGLKGALPITLCGDELSYVESPRLIRQGKGERLILYPRAVSELGQGLGQLLQTLSEQ